MDNVLTTKAADDTPTASLKLDSVVLARLSDEVRNGAISSPSAYNRMHNRHNR